VHDGLVSNRARSVERERREYNRRCDRHTVQHEHAHERGEHAGKAAPNTPHPSGVPSSPRFGVTRLSKRLSPPIAIVVDDPDSRSAR
jgi:hypothetical protein